MCLQQFELKGASVAQSPKRPPPLYRTSDHTWEEFVHALPKVVCFLRVVRIPPTGKLTGWVRMGNSWEINDVKICK